MVNLCLFFNFRKLNEELQITLLKKKSPKLEKDVEARNGLLKYSLKATSGTDNINT